MDNVAKKILFTNTWTLEKLRETREQLGLTQQDIADIIGSSKPVISSLERGANFLGPTFYAYCNVIEKCYAYQMGYVPCYRKVGTSEYSEVIT